MKNIYYFKIISAIGGTEQFLYEIAKKYKDYDLTIYYDIANDYQLKRLKKLVRCKKRKTGEKVICDKAFFNFNIDMINDVEAKEYYFVIHANYDALGYTPPTHPKINHYIGVSEFATRRWKEDMGRDAERCYNPLTLEPKEKVMHLVSACRLDDPVKGGKRTLDLISALDRYCKENNRHYIWTIYTNSTNINIDSPNVCLMKPRVDVRPYIQDADYVLQLSNDMETYCYTINEALGYGVPIVTTPLSVVKELPIDDNMRIEFNYDSSNADEVAKQIFEKEVKPFKYKIPKDGWDKLLEPGKSTYKNELETKVVFKAMKKYYDLELNREVNKDEELVLYKDRAEELLEKKIGIILNEINTK